MSRQERAESLSHASGLRSHLYTQMKGAGRKRAPPPHKLSWPVLTLPGWERSPLVTLATTICWAASPPPAGVLCCSAHLEKVESGLQSRVCHLHFTSEEIQRDTGAWARSHRLEGWPTGVLIQYSGEHRIGWCLETVDQGVRGSDMPVGDA